jgi:hypothetical protein
MNSDGEPCALQQAPDALLLDELQCFVVELIAHLPGGGQCQYSKQ